MKKSRYHLMLISGLFLAIFLTSCFCTQKIKVLPKSLPTATLGIPYYEDIKVFGGVVRNESFLYKIEPENSGLEISPTDFGKQISFNDLKVKGTPRVAGPITIILSGSTYPTMCPGRELNKTYTIKVEE
ncbi:hypothetical protein [uncultured Apibacter sp.]|uniref:hypothetical protein n=1 Tax=uncultured Apibacter sp. TaxID=1778616 RepID=UPI0025F90427|nr:hypothetical protein [uncultured Apibacter sp.]